MRVPRVTDMRACLRSRSTRLTAKGDSLPDRRILRRTASTVLWLLFVGLWSFAVETWGAWGFLVLLVWPPM